MKTTLNFAFRQLVIASSMMFGVLSAHSMNLIDAGIHTIDPKTHLQWLDLSITDGLSKNQVDLELAQGNRLDSYRYATYDEVAALWSNIGIVGARYDYIRWWPQNVEPIIGLANLIGGFTGRSGGGCLDILGGITATPTLAGTYLAPYLFLSNAPSCLYGYSGQSVHVWSTFADTPNAEVGSWLVSKTMAPVPEPSTLILLIVGALLLASYTRAVGVSRHHIPERQTSDA